MIVIRIWEGLGNQLFQYAYARTLMEKGLDVRLDVLKYYDNTFKKYRNNDNRTNSIEKFKITVPIASEDDLLPFEYIKRESKSDNIKFYLAQKGMWKYKFHEEKWQRYNEKMNNISGNCYVKGWFQSERYFKTIRHVLLEELTLKESFDIDSELEDMIQSPSSVSIHLRRGDYVKAHHELNAAYYHQAIKRILQSVKEPKFIVFSDDIDWVRRHVEIPGEVKYVTRDSGLEDCQELELMSCCKANIISNSTFSWWAAWLNKNPNKIVLAPKKWINGQEGIVPEEWIIV